MTLRRRELIYLVTAAIAVTAAYAAMFIARSGVLSVSALGLGLLLLVLFVVAHVAIREFAPRADPFLLPAALLLVGFGLTMIERLDQGLAERQLIWLVVGIVVLVAILWKLRDHHVLERYKYVIGVAAVVALAVTVSPAGEEVGGSRLWINFHVFSFQPGEFAKLAIVIFLAAYLRERRELLSMRVSLRDLGPLALFWLASLALFVLMNDFGSALLFYGTFLLMLYVATSRVWYALGGLIAFVGGSVGVYHLVGHVRERFDVWLNPFQTIHTTGYQLVQGLYGLAEGGLVGRGLGHAYLVGANGLPVIPAAPTDFIFAALADELGLVGAIGLLLVYVVVVWRGFRISARCHDGFSKLLAFGLSTTFALQTLIVVGGIVRLLPLTGQTLPFVSYGGSSLLANFALIGILLIISHRTANEDARIERALRR